jgi:predicted transcriptional regulator
MNLSFADTLYFKKENTLEIILGLHRSYKSLQREIQICCELNNLTFNELIVILEIKKGFKKKIDIANKVFLKKQNLNLILKDLQIKNILNLDNKTISITKNGEELIEKTTNRINEKIIKMFKKIDPKNMSGFINIIESL